MDAADKEVELVGAVPIVTLMDTGASQTHFPTVMYESVKAIFLAAGCKDNASSYIICQCVPSKVDPKFPTFMMHFGKDGKGETKFEYGPA